MKNKNLDKEERLTQMVRTRLTKTAYDRLIDIMQKSNCTTVGGIARKILSKEKIACYYIDTTMNAPMEELAAIRSELKAIGMNINQQTRFFNASKNDAQRSFYSLKTLTLYKMVDKKVEHLLDLVGMMSIKWLQES